MSDLGRWDVPLTTIIGWCWRRLSPAARRWLARELAEREGMR